MVTTQLTVSINALQAIAQVRTITGALGRLSNTSSGTATSLGILDAQFKRLFRFAGPTAAAFGFSEVFDQSRALTEAALDNAQRLESLFRLTDILPEQLQAFERFAVSQGVSQVDLSETLIGLTENLGVALDARLKGSETIRGAFSELGFSMADLVEGAKNADAFLLDVLNRFQELETAAEKFALGREIFGGGRPVQTAVSLSGFEGDIAATLFDDKLSQGRLSNEVVRSGAAESRELAVAQLNLSLAAQGGALESSAGSLIDLAETLQDPAFTRGAEGLGTAAGSIIELAASGADVALENVAPVNSNNEDVEQSFDFEAEVDPATNTTLQLDYFAN